MDIVEIKGAELSDLLFMLRANLRERGGAVVTMRVAIDEGAVKFKFNEGMWTRRFGETA